MSDQQIIERSSSSDEEDTDYITFDFILSTKTGFGIYQIIVLCIVSLIDFIDGAEQYYMMILVQVLQNEWKLADKQIELLGSFYFIGLFIGAIVSGIFCDWFGRKNSMAIGCFLQLCTVIWTALAPDFSHMLAIRAFYGIVIGMTLPIGILMMTEIVPKHIRGRCLILTQSAYMLGKFYLLLLCLFFMDDLSKGNWRAIAICQVFPCSIMTIGCLFFLDDSARFLVSHNRIDEAVVILNRTGQKNKQNQYEPITQYEIEGLKKWQQAHFAKQPTTFNTFKGLFKGSNFGVTWRLITANCVNSFVSSGTLFLLPFYLHSTGQGLFELFLATLGEVPASIIVYLFIDVQSVGRLKILNITLLLSTISLLLIYLIKEPFLLAGLVSIKFFSRFTGLCSIPLISESYDTIHRSLGLGFCTAVGRAMGAISPFILYEVYLFNKWVVFLIFASLVFITFVTFLSFPVDKTSKPLDQDHTKEINTKSGQQSPQIKISHQNEDTASLLTESKYNQDEQTVVSRSALKDQNNQ
ncbi:hypothetical protein ABPG72_008985 [Tetrahymena utriculariae]